MTTATRIAARSILLCASTDSFHPATSTVAGVVVAIVLAGCGYGAADVNTFGAWPIDRGRFEGLLEAAPTQLVDLDVVETRFQIVDGVAVESDGLMLGRPGGIAVSAAGELLIADEANHAVFLVSPADRMAVRVAGQAGAGPGEFSTPTHVGVSGSSFVVYDSGNNRVQKIALGSLQFEESYPASYFWFFGKMAVGDSLIYLPDAASPERGVVRLVSTAPRLEELRRVLPPLVDPPGNLAHTTVRLAANGRIVVACYSTLPYVIVMSPNGDIETILQLSGEIVDLAADLADRPDRARLFATALHVDDSNRIYFSHGPILYVLAPAGDGLSYRLVDKVAFRKADGRDLPVYDLTSIPNGMLALISRTSPDVFIARNES